MKRMIAIVLVWILVLACIPSVSAAGGRPDLVPETLLWTGGDGQVIPGTALTISVTVTNRGTADVTVPFAVDIYTAVTHILHQMVDGLAAGQSVTVTFPVWRAIAGDYMVVAAVDGAQAVSESGEKNNTCQRNLRVANDRLTSVYDSTANIQKAAGMTDLIFSDDFTSSASVDNQLTKQAGYKWYITRPYGAPDLTSTDYSVANGVMTVKNAIPTYNYGLGTTDMDSHVGFVFNTGYLEIKLRIPRPRKNTEKEKGVPAIWALPAEKLFDNTEHWVELDWMEYWGDDYYTISLHEQKRKSGGETTQWTKNSNSRQSGLNDGEWHVMGWLWQEGLFISYMDGEEVMRLTWKEGELAWPIQTVNTGELEEGAFVRLDEQRLPIIIGGSQDNPMELDWVRVWDGNTTGTYVPPKKEDEKKPIVVQMAAADFIHNFTTDDYADPIKRVTKENCQNVLRGESVWNTLSDARRAEINDLLRKNGQETYEVLLADAKQVNTVNTTAKATVAITKKPVKPSAAVTTTVGKGETETTVTVTEPTTTPVTTGTTVAKEDTEEETFPWIALLPMGVAVLVAVGLPLWLTYKKKKQ